ncbi:hypothetical protein FB451DRAFT_1277539, partial [Mycena latifolia]
MSSFTPTHPTKTPLACRLPSFRLSRGKAQKVLTNRDVKILSALLSRSCATSTSSLASTASSSTCVPTTPPTEKWSNARAYPSACAEMIVSGVSALLIMPMPILDNAKRSTPTAAAAETETDAPPSVQKRMSKFQLPRRPPTPPRRRRNSLVLPEVLMPAAPPPPLVRPMMCATRSRPPPMEDRAIRFVVPPPKSAPPTPAPDNRWGDEVAWSDFM